MRHALIAVGMAACLGLCAQVTLGAPRGRGGDGGGGGGGNIGGAISGAVEGGSRGGDGGARISAPGGVNIDGGAKMNVDRGRDGANVDGGSRANFNADRGNDRNRNSTRNRIGDSGWDRWGIGPLDVNRYARYGDRDNSWRYRRNGNEWWYWVPGNYWMYWRGDRWNRYDADTYAYDDNYNNGYVAERANFNGPYYEDSNGFYYMQGGRRIYDPQIQRMARTEGPIQR